MQKAIQCDPNMEAPVVGSCENVPAGAFCLTARNLSKRGAILIGRVIEAGTKDAPWQQTGCVAVEPNQSVLLRTYSGQCWQAIDKVTREPVSGPFCAYGPTTWNITDIPDALPKADKRTVPWTLLLAGSSVALTVLLLAMANQKKKQKTYISALALEECIAQLGAESCPNAATALSLGFGQSHYPSNSTGGSANLVVLLITIAVLVVIFGVGLLASRGLLPPYRITYDACKKRGSTWTWTPVPNGKGTPTMLSSFLCRHAGLCYCRSPIREYNCRMIDAGSALPPSPPPHPMNESTSSSLSSSSSSSSDNDKNAYTYDYSIAEKNTQYNCACLIPSKPDISKLNCIVKGCKLCTKSDGEDAL